MRQIVNNKIQSQEQIRQTIISQIIIKKEMMQQGISEFHTVRVSVSIKTIHLLVRFPCRLSFQLKTDNGSTETINTYQLKKGQCDVNQTLQVDLDLAYDNHRGCYEDKKIKLVVMMSSANGTIPAGMVMFNPCESQPLQRSEQTMSLEKCPDRSANVRFTRWYQFLRTAGNGNTMPTVHHSTYLDTRYTLKANNKPSQMKHSTYTNNDAYGRNSKYSPIKRDTTPTRRDITPSRFNGGKNQLSVNNGQNNLPLTSRSRVRTYTSPVYENEHTGNFNNPSQDYRMAESYIEQPSYGHTASFYPMNQSAFVGNHPQQNVRQDQFQGYNSMRMQQHQQQQPSKLQFGQKANFLKEIAKLRGEVKSLQNEDKWEQLIKVKDQNQTLMMELEKQKEKFRIIEKKDREYNVTIKQTKDELQRMRLKLTNVEGLKNQIELNLAEKDKKLKQSLVEIKKLEEKISDMQLTVSTGQKRIEFKQNSFQQQLQKLTQKYNSSESQRQKVTFEYNSLLTRMEENEKKFQLNQKDKERFYNEEKNKLTKKLDGVTQQLEKLKEDYQDKDVGLGELSVSYKSLVRKQAEKEARVVQLENQVEHVTVGYRKEEEQRKSLESQVTMLRQVEEERNSLKKKYNENMTELTRTKEKYDHLHNDHTHLTIKSKDQDQLIQQLKKQRSQLNSRINILTKQVEELSKSHQKKSREQEVLSAQTMNTTQRLNDLRSKLETEQRDYTEMAMQYEEQINYFTKAKEYAQAEIEDLKWTVERQKEQYEQLADKLKESTEETLMLNKEILQSGDRIKRLQEELSETQAQSKSRLTEKLSLEEKERQLQETIKARTAENYQLSKAKLQLEQQVYLMKEKLQQSQAYQKDRSSTDEKTLKDKEKEINLATEELTKSQLELLHLKEEVNSMNQSLTIRTNEITHLKDSLQLSQQKLNDLELKKQQLREQLKNANFQLSNLRTENESIKQQLSITHKANEKTQQQWQQYRVSTTTALQQLILEVSKDEDSTSSSKQSLLLFPDMNISSMQVEMIKKRNSIISAYRERITLLERDIAATKHSYDKLKQKHEEKENQHDFVMVKEKERTKQLLHQAAGERQLLTEEFRKSEETNIQLMGEVQRLTNEIKKGQEILEETKAEAKQLLAERQHLKLEVKNLEEKILDMKSREIKSKATSESKFSQMNDQSEQEILKMKASLIETQRKLLSQERIISQKEESIKRLQTEQVSVTNERNRVDQKALQLNEKVNALGDEKKLLEKRIKLLEKEVKEQTQLYQQAVESASNEKTKLEQVKARYNETFEQLTDSQVDNEKLKQELEICVSNISTLQTTLKEKEQKYRSTEHRLSDQVKELKQTLITLNSELQLRSFISKQLEDSLASVKENLQEAKQQLFKKKEEIIKLGDQLDSKKTTLLKVDQSLTINKNEKESCREENDRLRNRINALEAELNENRLLEDILDMKEKDLRKLKDEQEVNRRHYEKGLADMRSVSTERNRLSTSRNVSKDDDLRRKVRELEQLLEVKHYDLAVERKKWQAEAEREKRQLHNYNNELNQRIEDMQSEFDFQRTQLNKEIESLGEQNDELMKVVQEKEEVIFLIENLVGDIENGNTSKVHQLKANVEELKRSIENRIRENSLSKDRHKHNHSFSQEHKWINNGKQTLFENNHEVPSPVEFDNSSLPRQFYSNQILNDETIKEPSSEEVVTNTVEAEVNGN